MPRGSWIDYESGKTRVPAALLEKLVEVTGCDANWLLTGIGEPYPTVSTETDAARRTLEHAWRAAVSSIDDLAESLVRLDPLLARSLPVPTGREQVADKLRDLADRLDRRSQLPTDEPADDPEQ